ncbi:hypothetical protein Scel_59450 [Streptomyces cellostaticus]|nr:hypothetical protein Scel_59450 [Streptomyces cellostaticus]
MHADARSFSVAATAVPGWAPDGVRLSCTIPSADRLPLPGPGAATDGRDPLLFLCGRVACA